VADAQTSGGLVLAVPAEVVPEVLRDLNSRRTLAAAVIGRAVERGEALLTVRLTAEG
jgi:hydrogenase maturation factor